MSGARFAAIVLVIGLAAAAWLVRDSGQVARARQALGLSTEGSAATSLRAAGVHKCVGAGGTRYLDGPCPKGSREVAANGGTMTVVSFPKPAPVPSVQASGAFGGALVKPLDPDERDRLRDKAIEDAANRR